MPLLLHSALLLADCVSRSYVSTLSEQRATRQEQRSARTTGPPVCEGAYPSLNTFTPPAESLTGAQGAAGQRPGAHQIMSTPATLLVRLQHCAGSQASAANADAIQAAVCNLFSELQCRSNVGLDLDNKLGGGRS